MILLYIYLGIGFLYSFLTVGDTLQDLQQRYPRMKSVGHTKFKRFMLAWFKSSALGIAVIIHFIVMTALYPIDLISKKMVK